MAESGKRAGGVDVDPGPTGGPEVTGPPVPQQTRLSVNINQATASAIKNFASKHNISATEAVRRLVSYGNLIAEAAAQEKEILLRDDKTTEKIVVL